MNFNDKAVSLTPKLPDAHWQKILDSADEKWEGAGAKLPTNLTVGQSVLIPPVSFAFYQAER